MELTGTLSGDTEYEEEEDLTMTLELYKKNTCPYCRKVMDFISSTGRTDIIFKDIQSDPEAEKILVTTGGKKQVPCLFIDSRPMYESLDIIKWLEDHPQA